MIDIQSTIKEKLDMPNVIPDNYFCFCTTHVVVQDTKFAT